jgi:hypothetical protein
LASPDMSMSLTESITLASPVVHSTILVAPKAALSSPAMIDANSILLGCTQTAPVTSLTPFPVGSTQIVPSGPVILRDGSDSASDLAVSEAQLLVNGLTEAQAWFLGWLRDGTRSQELLAAIDCFEVQTRRKNEGALPLVCPMELPKVKVMLEVGIWDANMEIVLRNFVFFVAASLEVGSSEAAAGVPAVTSTATARTGSITPPVVRGKFFLFPPVLEDAPTFVGLAKRPFGSKTTSRREAIQLYRITRRELEHRISTACSVYFGDKDWG